MVIAAAATMNVRFQAQMSGLWLLAHGNRVCSQSREPDRLAGLLLPMAA
jgi:hypothetical protein